MIDDEIVLPTLPDPLDIADRQLLVSQYWKISFNRIVVLNSRWLLTAKLRLYLLINWQNRQSE